MAQASCGVRQCRLRHVPLVSRRFSEACRDPSLWPDLRVRHHQFSTEARWRSFLRWLAARGSGLQTLAFGGAWQVWPLKLLRFVWRLVCINMKVFQRQISELLKLPVG